MSKPASLRYSTYIIQMGVAGQIKIGKSKNVKQRLVDIQRGVPYTLRVLALFGYDIESKLHKRFKGLRTRGEWFRDDGSIREFVDRVRSNKPTLLDMYCPAMAKVYRACERIDIYLEDPDVMDDDQRAQVGAAIEDVVMNAEDLIAHGDWIGLSLKCEQHHLSDLERVASGEDNVENHRNAAERIVFIVKKLSEGMIFEAYSNHEPTVEALCA